MYLFTSPSLLPFLPFSLTSSFPLFSFPPASPIPPPSLPPSVSPSLSPLPFHPFLPLSFFLSLLPSYVFVL